MYYIIKNNNVNSISESHLKNNNNDVFIEIIDEKNIEEKHTQYDFIMQTYKKIDSIHAPRAEIYNHFYFLTIPIRDSGGSFKESKYNFVLYLLKDRIVFIGNEESVLDIINKSISQGFNSPVSAIDVLAYMLQWIIDTENQYLKTLEENMEILEETILTNKNIHNLSATILTYRKTSLYSHHYYDQLYDIVSEIMENENNIINDVDLNKLQKLDRKFEKISDKAKILEEYTLQLREMNQTSIDSAQSKTMQRLTFVTIIFSILAVITGWFGMNFKYMWLLDWEHAYPVLIVFVSTLVIVLIQIFKKKKFF